MPSTRVRVSATTANALATNKFRTIPPIGALISLWIAGVTSTDSFSLAIGNQDIVPASTVINVEASADVIDTDRDQVVFMEPIPGGELSMPVTVTTEAQALIALRYGG